MLKDQDCLGLQCDEHLGVALLRHGRSRGSTTDAPLTRPISEDELVGDSPPVTTERGSLQQAIHSLLKKLLFRPFLVLHLADAFRD